MNDLAKKLNHLEIGKLYRIYAEDISSANYWVGWEHENEFNKVICELYYGDIVMLLDKREGKSLHLKLLTEDGICAWFYYNSKFYELELFTKP